MKTFDVIILGAGTSGLTARKEIARHTDNYVLVDDGPLGTTCARVGCMPSKVIIQVANDFHRRAKFEQMGISGADQLKVDGAAVMKHVRSLRDRFVRGVKSGMPEWEDKLVRGRAQFLDSNTIEVNGAKMSGKKIIIATGSRPIIPGPWVEYKDFLIDTDSFFELEQLPKSVAVIGLGIIGLELGQALHRLGVNVIGFTVGKGLGGLTDPELQDYFADKLSKEFPVHFNGAQLTGVSPQGLLRVEADGKTYEFEKALVAVGRKANVDNMGLEKLGIPLNKLGIPEINFNTMKLKDLPHIFLPGDVNAQRPLLHEAADEGTIAGYNATHDEQCFKRRTPLAITFTDPSIATIGKRYSDLKDDNREFVTGKVSFEGQGRSIVKLKEQGLLHIYADPSSGEILGAEIHGPEAEHLAHLLAWSISMKITVFEAVKMPFYHPVIEEGLEDIAASAGNHAQGVALTGKKLGIQPVIVMPHTTPPIKVDSVKARGAKVVLHGDTYDEASEYSIKLAMEKGMTHVHPFDDPEVIAGQGTVGMEILRQVTGPLDAVFVPVGGGGLLAGVAAYIRYVRPEVKLIGVEAEDSACMKWALEKNRRITLPEVGIFADGVAVAQAGKETFKIIRECVDEIITVTTDEICAAVKDIFNDTRSIAEPAGALSTAGLKKYIEREGIKGQTLLSIDSGANVNFDRLRHIAERAELGEKGEAILAVTIPEKPGSFKAFCGALGKRNITEFNYRSCR